MKELLDTVARAFIAVADAADAMREAKLDEAKGWVAFRLSHEQMRETQRVIAELQRSCIEVNDAALEAERARRASYEPAPAPKVEVHTYEPEASAELSAARKVVEAARVVMADTRTAKAFDMLGLALESYYDARGKE